MTYNEFVSRPSVLLQRISHKIEDVQLKWTVCLNTVPELSERIQTSVSNTTETTILRYTQAKMELDDLIAEYDASVNGIRTFLYSNLNSADASVLDWKYCHDKSIQEIAELEGMSYSGASNRIYRADKKAAKSYKLGRFEKEK